MSTAVKNPFKFLDSFSEKDKDIFFGRDQEIDDLYELLSQTDLVLLYGETGTGKTSLVNCGLTKRYDETDWLPLYIRRNHNINISLREFLEGKISNNQDNSIPLPKLVQAVYWEYLRPIYLIFDQLEELFILGDHKEQTQFIQQIEEILEFNSESKVIFIFREEYLAHLNLFEKSIPTLFDKRLRIEAMREPKAIEVIEQTCSFSDIRLASSKIPSNILDVITEEGRLPINLPYLQVFLDKLFKKAAEKDPNDIFFNHQLIKEIGSLGNVLTRLLEDQVAFVQEQLEDKSSVWVFLKFFVTADGTKKPVYRSEIFEQLGKLIQNQDKITYCLNYFTNTHILRPLDKGQYELTHDSIAAKIHRAQSKERNLIPLIEGNPYKGLAPYEQTDSGLFFGRDKVIRDVYNRMINKPLTIITGISGSGKSSLVKAGILPKLKADGFNIHVMLRPGNHPEENLKKVLDKINKGKHEGKGYVFVVDQYEELITRTEKIEERDSFIDILKTLIKKPEKYIPEIGEQKLKILITVRSDFEPQFEQLGLKDYWYDAKYVITPLSRAELREIVEKPAYLAAFDFEPEELVDRMIDEVLGGAGSLPLLSFSLSLLYENCKDRGRIITEEAYREIGGVIGSLKTHADQIYDGLDEVHKYTMQRIMLRMVSLEGSEIASRRVYIHEYIYSDSIENERVQTVLELLISNRLIVKGVDQTSVKSTYVEPAHDALVWGWGTLWEWINNFGKENLFLQDSLNKQVQLYLEHDENPEYLWTNDPRLDQAVAGLVSRKKGKIESSFLKRIDNELKLYFPKKTYFEAKDLTLNKFQKGIVPNAIELQFLSRSYKLKEQQNRRIILLSLIAAIVFLILAGVGVGLAGLARKAEKEADNQKNIAIFEAERAKSLRLRADSLKEQALIAKDTAEAQKLKAEEAKLIAEAAEIEAELRRKEAEAEKNRAQEAEEKALIEQGKAETAKAKAEQERIRAENKALVANLLAAQRMATRSRDIDLNRVLAWEKDSIRVNKLLGAQQAFILNENYRIDNNGNEKGNEHDPNIYSALEQGLKAYEGKEYNQYKSANADAAIVKGGVSSIAFSGDSNKFYVSGKRGELTVFKFGDLDDPGRSIDTDYRSNQTLALSNVNGKEYILVTKQQPGELRLIQDRGDKIELTDFSLKDQKGRILDVAFVPKSLNLIVATDDGNIMYYGWDDSQNDISEGPQMNRKVDSLSPDQDEIRNLAIHPISSKLVASGKNGQVYVWDDIFNSTVISKNDSMNNRIELIRTLSIRRNPVNVLCFSSDGKWLVGGDELGQIRVWNGNNLQKHAIPEYTLRGHKAGIESLTFSNPSAPLLKLASGSRDNTVRMWVFTPERLKRFGHEPIIMEDQNLGSSVMAVTFTPDGRYLLAGYKGGQIKQWPTSLSQMANIVCSKVDRNLTAKAWNDYLGRDEKDTDEDLAYRCTCIDGKPNMSKEVGGCMED